MSRNPAQVIYLVILFFLQIRKDNKPSKGKIAMGSIILPPHREPRIEEELGSACDGLMFAVGVSVISGCSSVVV